MPPAACWQALSSDGIVITTILIVSLSLLVMNRVQGCMHLLMQKQPLWLCTATADLAYMCAGCTAQGRPGLVQQGSQTQSVG